MLYAVFQTTRECRGPGSSGCFRAAPAAPAPINPARSPGDRVLPCRGDALGAHRRGRHARGEIGGFGPGEIFSRVFGRQHLDHLLVLDPHLDHVKRTAVAVEAVPAFARGDSFYFVRVGRDAEREMSRGKLARLFSNKAAADLTPRAQFGAGRIDLHTRAMVV